MRFLFIFIFEFCAKRYEKFWAANNLIQKQKLPRNINTHISYFGYTKLTTTKKWVNSVYFLKKKEDFVDLKNNLFLSLINQTKKKENEKQLQN
jgi:hypothetical protein